MRRTLFLLTALAKAFFPIAKPSRGRPAAFSLYSMVKYMSCDRRAALNTRRKSAAVNNRNDCLKLNSEVAVAVSPAGSRTDEQADRILPMGNAKVAKDSGCANRPTVFPVLPGFAANPVVLSGC